MTDITPFRWLWGSPEQRALARCYWINDTFKGSVNTLAHLSLKMLPTDLCSAGGALASRFSPYRFRQSDARARKNWKLLCPDDSDPAVVDAAMRRLWASIARTLAEFSALNRIWDEGRVAVEGQEHLAAATSADKPVLIAALHLGNWELIAPTMLSFGHKLSGIYLVPSNRFKHRIAYRARQRFYSRMIPALQTSGFAAIREIRTKRPFIIWIDDFVRGHVAAPAFGRPLKPLGNIAHLVRLAALTGALVLPAYCIRIGDAARFKVTFMPLVDMVNTGDADADRMTNIASLDAAVEPVVREHLDQWYYLNKLDLGK